MRILAIESAAAIASVALTEEETLLHLAVDRSGHAHSETLLPLIAQALETHRLTVKDIDMFAVSVGPGSYTGIRIGAATVKGLASGSGKPCVPVSSLLSLARGCASLRGLICPVMDARRDQMYTALFDSRNGALTRLSPDELLPIAELGRRLKKTGRKVFFTGDGCAKTAAGLPFLKIGETPALLACANAYHTALCALDIYRAHPDENYDETRLLPVYLKETQAERERKEREAGGEGGKP